VTVPSPLSFFSPLGLERDRGRASTGLGIHQRLGDLDLRGPVAVGVGGDLHALAADVDRPRGLLPALTGGHVELVLRVVVVAAVPVGCRTGVLLSSDGVQERREP
jgi:hypothetical protein